MLILYLYPQMFGLPDNNPFGLKVDTFLRLHKISYIYHNIIDIKNAPRGQLPYIDDGGNIITDSNHIIDYLCEKHHLQPDKHLSDQQKNLQFLITRTLDNHLYWVMSYSRWQDERFWPEFKEAFLKQCPDVSEATLIKAREYNIEKYHFQGIGRYEADAIYQSGIADLQAVDNELGQQTFLFGDKIHTVDVVCYGFLANIFYFKIDTPLRAFLKQQKRLRNYVSRIRERLDY
ncbi:glutathione S-transferase family protein [Legionella israelensis]|uniref:Glutathione S-transferase family protein n=1 Tax=Legionella israelensis TaxID=454 RepID=A0AAX1EJM5_9GAMM|nr:glutathione S-transferase family protein [Legionella israelensis]QBR85002.1 glutathione S-transferase family protein [Legionella israelensis]